PDVDDRHRPAILQTALRQGDHAGAAAPAFLRRLCWAMRLGAWLFSASPRPDRLGLVMKYSCALKGSSPSSSTTRREVPSGNTSKLCWLSMMFPTMIWPNTCS